MDMPSRRDHSDHAHHRPPSAPQAGELKDPVCGMSVTAQSEHHALHAGRPYDFRSAKCLFEPVMSLPCLISLLRNRRAPRIAGIAVRVPHGLHLPVYVHRRATRGEQRKFS